MKLTVVLWKGRWAELFDPETYAGMPMMAEPGGSRRVGTVERAWREGDEIRAVVEVDDPAFADLLGGEG